MDWETILKFASDNGFSIALAIIGIATSWLFSWWYFRRATSSKRIWFTRRNAPLVRRTNSLRGIRITFDERPLDRPYLADFIVWNSGNTAIRSTDIAPSAPLRLVAPNARFVSGVVTQSSKKENNCEATVTDGDVLLSFDYLDPGDGIVLEIIAELMTNNDDLNIELQGSVIGQTHKISYIPGLRSLEQIRSIRLISLFMVVASAAMSIFGLVNVIRPDIFKGLRENDAATPIFSIFLLCMDY